MQDRCGTACPQADLGIKGAKQSRTCTTGLVLHWRWCFNMLQLCHLLSAFEAAIRYEAGVFRPVQVLTHPMNKPSVLHSGSSMFVLLHDIPWLQSGLWVELGTLTAPYKTPRFMFYQATPLSTNQTTPLKTNHGSKKWMNSKIGPNRRFLNIGNQTI